MIEKDRLVCLKKPPSSILQFIFTKEAFYEKPLILADREMVETQSDEILHNAGTEDVSLLVVGDPFGCDPFFHVLKILFDLLQCNYAYRYNPSSSSIENPHPRHS